LHIEGLKWLFPGNVIITHFCIRKSDTNTIHVKKWKIQFLVWQNYPSFLVCVTFVYTKCVIIPLLVINISPYKYKYTSNQFESNDLIGSEALIPLLEFKRVFQIFNPCVYLLKCSTFTRAKQRSDASTQSTRTAPSIAVLAEAWPKVLEREWGAVLV
jgi:hypothetical protein